MFRYLLCRDTLSDLSKHTTLIVVCTIYIRDVPQKGVRHEQIGKT